MTEAEKLDVASMFAADVERGRRVLALMEKRPLTVQDAQEARRFAQGVWEGKVAAPERLGDPKVAPLLR